MQVTFRMPRSARAGLLLAFTAICLGAGVSAQNGPNQGHRVGAGLPFTLTWTQGVCRNCKTAHSISGVQFVASNEAWAIGFMPPGETGEGDYSVLHTRDGGKSWTEIPEPWQHNSAPDVSFANAREGWLRDMDIEAAETRLLETIDGGSHWRKLPPNDLFLNEVQYIGNGIGYATGYDIYKKQGYLIATLDHGRTWIKSLFPPKFSPDQMQFSDSQHGVIAGCIDRRPAVIRTADGGRHWSVTSLDLPRATSKDLQICDDMPDSLNFLDTQHGWLLTSKHVFGLHDDKGSAVAWSTRDGGASWTPVYHATFPAGREQFYSLNFLNAHLGVLLQSVMQKDESVGVLLYTTDGGNHWERIALPHQAWGCRRFDEALECAAGYNGFWLLKISPVSQKSN